MASHRGATVPRPTSERSVTTRDRETARSAGQNVVIDAHAIAMDLEADLQRIAERAAELHADVEVMRTREIDAARLRARERATRLFRIVGAA